ncbi:aspartate aminotransferase family protein [Rubellimicrobium aerolatum]|uniref:Aspartate aminotransferase family protein n=1 Tax=Rubellimicrobium aerolatum TaxID=490979 RepID=A0ABW0SGY7_9RHOB|nr:aminotransferase class III-fold pyridoxal phosphate-dependent enzyme [Rubellimicrobium aerolatum]MBP1807514.1 4-aminobutyrate aminotransferase-like enzyme [Rubellimicrobium aerolatum]
MNFGPGMVNAFVPGAVDLDPHEASMIERRQRLLGPAYRLFYERPIEVVRGEGVWLYDRDGKAYLDAYNNVASLGHCHPRVVDAICRQVATLATNTRYLHESVLIYAEQLLATMPSELGHLMFTCTGSDANDLAVRIARSFTGGEGVIVTETAYHGITKIVAEFSPSLGPSVDLGPHVRTVPAPDSYRSPTGDLATEFTVAVEAAIRDLRRHGIKPALFICDSIFSSDGVFGEQPGFLKGAVDAIRAAGGLYIADEVQPGFGRTGDAMWGFQRHGVIPDIVTLGKPMGNGFPVAGIVVRPEVIDEFGRKARYFNTFGGNAVAAEAARAVLSAIQDEDLMRNARMSGAYLKDGIKALAQRHDAIGDVRGAGLFVGVEIVSDRSTRTPDARTCTRIVNGLREAGVLISACGPSANVLKIRPPLVFTTENADFLIERLDRVMMST